MKKYILGAMLLFAASTSFCGEEINTATMSDMQKFYYNLGKSQGKQEYYLDGYRQAMADYQSILLRWKNDIKGYEAGKYLISESKITYPKVYRVKDESGAYRILIESPVVEKEFTEKDLFMIPLVTNRPSQNKEDRSAQIAANDATGESDGFMIPDRDDVTQAIRDSAPDVMKKRSTVHIPYRNDGIKNAIDSFNIQYTSTKDGYDLYFNNESEKVDFCMKITGNDRCKM